jgi:imidazolonepropionase-like amidohydrolase
MLELDRRFAVATAADAERAVDSLAWLGADFVKIRNFSAASAYFALVRSAKQRGLSVAGHAPPMSFVATISDSGFASLEHVLLDSRQGRLVEGLSQLSSDPRRAVLQRLARNGTAWTPTFVSGAVRFVADSTLSRIVADTAGSSDWRLRFVPRALREEWRTQLAMRSVDPDTSTDWAAIQRASLGALRDVADAGVLAGSDLGVAGLVPGFALPRELETMVHEGGLTPREALAAATINPARTLGIADSCGRVAVGHCADLVSLEGDPLADISAVRMVRTVIARGRY